MASRKFQVAFTLVAKMASSFSNAFSAAASNISHGNSSAQCLQKTLNGSPVWSAVF